MAHHNALYKNPDGNLKLKYRRWLETSLVVALIFVIGLFYAFKKFDVGYRLANSIEVPIRNIDIPRTDIFHPPPPPAQPRIPIESEDEDFPDDLTILPMEVQFNGQIESELSSIQEEEPTVPFPLLSAKPKVLRRVKPAYPEMALKAGIEGRVIVRVLINTRGNVEEVQIVQSNPMFDAAAVAAAREFKFRPGEQRKRPVKVWVTIPFTFKLRR